MLQKKLSIKDQVDTARPVDTESLPKEKTSAVPSSPRSPPRHLLSSTQTNLEHLTSTSVDPMHVRKTSLSGSQQTDKDVSLPFSSTSQVTMVSKVDTQKTAVAKTTEKSVSQLPTMTRPSSAPLVPGHRPIAPVVSIVHTAPLLARSVSASGRLGPDPSPATHSYVPQSYRNAIMGNHVSSNVANLTQSNSNSGVNPLPSYSQPPSMVSSPIYLPQTSERMDSNSGQSSVPFGMITRDVLQNGTQWIDNSQRETSRGMHYDPPSPLNDVQNIDLYKPLHSRSLSNMATEFPACTSGRQAQGLLVDEFPHLDIINDLLDDEHGIGKAAKTSSVYQSLNSGVQSLNRQFTSPGDLGTSDDLGSLTSSCRFERSRSYHDYGFQRGYSSSGAHFESMREYVPQASTLPYVNSHVDGLMQNQWQVAGSDLSYLGMRNTENDSYPYYPEYSSMACGVNGYTVYRPSNGQ